MLNDFYRRQYFNEIRLGVRNAGDTDTKFLMPPFTVFRPFGGAMPIPNGFNVETSYTTKKENYRMGSHNTGSSQSSDSNSGYNSNEISSPTRTFSSTGYSDHAEYQMDDEEFRQVIDAIDDGDEDVWEELERISPSGE